MSLTINRTELKNACSHPSFYPFTYEINLILCLEKSMGESAPLLCMWLEGGLRWPGSTCPSLSRVFPTPKSCPMTQLGNQCSPSVWGAFSFEKVIKWRGLSPADTAFSSLESTQIRAPTARYTGTGKAIEWPLLVYISVGFYLQGAQGNNKMKRNWTSILNDREQEQHNFDIFQLGFPNLSRLITCVGLKGWCFHLSCICISSS